MWAIRYNWKLTLIKNEQTETFETLKTLKHLDIPYIMFYSREKTCK